MDLVLINPSSRAQVYQSLGSTLTAVEPPVWAGMIATFARLRGYSVTIIDAEAEHLSHASVAERVDQFAPRLAVLVVYGHQPSASTQNMSASGAVVRAIKERNPDQKTLLLGGHVAALPKRTLLEEAADFVSCDEGLFTIVDLLEALKSASPDLSAVRGLWYRDGDSIRSNPAAPLLKNLDEEMPGIAWDLLPMDRYRAHNWHCFGGISREPYAALYTTLGCPYHCSFCCIQAPFKGGEKMLGLKESANSYRFWSPNSVIAQIDTLVETYGVRNIKIADEMFVLNPRHVNAICDLLIERDYGLNIWAYTRVDTIKPQMLDKLKRAGVNWLAFGIEAANARVRDDVQKGFQQDEIVATIRGVQAAGINIIGNYIFGLPEDDRDTMQETLDMALDLNCEFANFYSTMAYPGSQLYEVATKNGWPLPEKWTGYSQHAENTLPLPTRHLSGTDVLAFRDHAFQVYFNAPSYISMLDAKFGPETVAAVREMNAHRLSRRAA